MQTKTPDYFRGFCFSGGRVRWDPGKINPQPGGWGLIFTNRFHRTVRGNQHLFQGRFLFRLYS